MSLPSFAAAHMKEVGEKGLRRTLRAVQRISPREIVIEGKHCLDFSSNDYMSLSMRPELIDEAKSWTDRWGAGSGASRLISGTSDACLELEDRIARWKGFEAALIIGSGYLGNLGVVDALARRDSAIFADKLNHNSIVKGCVLSQSKLIRYRHNDVEHLRFFLERENLRETLVVSDTVFSMDGDIAPLDRLYSASKAHDAIVYLDDAHGTGVFGHHGKGLASAENCDVALSTFSKAIGSYGACISSSREMKEYLINTCAPFIFSTALPPAILGAVSAAVELMQTSEAEQARKRLLARSAEFRRAMTEAGYEVGSSESMIVPVILGDAVRTLEFSKALKEAGFCAMAVRPPTVPQGTSRLRLSFNAAHTDSDFEKLLEFFQKQAR